MPIAPLTVNDSDISLKDFTSSKRRAAIKDLAIALHNYQLFIVIYTFQLGEILQCVRINTIN